MTTRKIYAIIQARMSSSRLPRKVLRKIDGKPMLHYVIKQVKGSKLLEGIIIATTTEKEDDVIAQFCKNNKIKVFRGSKHDLLDRYYQCAKKYHCDPVVRITSDCPLVDPEIIDKVLSKFLNGSYDYISNNLDKINGKWDNSMCNFPQGMTVEVSTFAALEKAWKEAKKPSEREHVFPYIQFNPKLFKVSRIKFKKDLSYIRCTVDRMNDLVFVRQIYKRLPKARYITITDIVNIVKKEPNLVKINNEIPFDEGYQISLIEDRKSGF
jgi:spore coat polysaccharide biosynthesis protein SpsF